MKWFDFRAIYTWRPFCAAERSNRLERESFDQREEEEGILRKYLQFAHRPQTGEEPHLAEPVYLPDGDPRRRLHDPAQVSADVFPALGVL